MLSDRGRHVLFTLRRMPDYVCVFSSVVLWPINLKKECIFLFILLIILIGNIICYQYIAACGNKFIYFERVAQ